MEEIMKKNLSKILSLMLIAVMIFTFAACGSNGNAGDAEGPVSLSIATGGTSGTYYGYCGIIAQVFNQELGDTMNLSAVSTGASMANIQQMQVGASQIAIVQNDVMDYAYNATDLFEGQDPYTDFSTIMVCYPETIQIIAQKNITSIDQLKGKRVSTGDAGSGVEFNARQILAAYGLDIDADIVKNSQSFADSADALKNGQIDAAFVVAGAPTTAVTELAASGYKFNLLEIDAEHAEQLKSQYGFYTDITVPAGTYTPVDKDVKTVAVMATLACRNDVPTEVVYEFTKGMFELKDKLGAAGFKDKFDLVDQTTAVTGSTVPFHPGAEQYFKEIGAM